jgi:glyoxylase-like metal-dependent hydrolase (beta-lactamase superfamily II)
MRIITLYPGSWGSNCYILLSGSHAAVVDPSPRAEQILNILEENDAVLDYILLTHGHFDHIVSLDTLRDLTQAPALIHQGDAELPADPKKNAFYYFFHMNQSYREPERSLTADEILMLGDETIRVIHTPGHTRGSVCYLCNEDFLLTGDTIFDVGRGRTDLYGGDEALLLETLRNMRSLPQSLPIYPGHGTSTTLGEALNHAFYC